MNRKLKRIGPLKFGIVLGVFYALISLIIIPFMLIGLVAGMFIPNNSSGGAAQQAIGIGFGLVMCVLAPVLYGLFGFLFGMLGAWIYNVIAKWTGGIEFEVE